MTVNEMKEKKLELGLPYEQIANLSGLPLGTVRKVLGGITKAPRQVTLQALEKAFVRSVNASYLTQTNRGMETTEVVRETTVYGYEKKQGEYTLDDYYAIPDDRRVELIDGVIYDMASPTTIHQLLVAQI